MSFNSYIYVFAFLPIVWFVYAILRTTRFSNIWLAFASFVFYAWQAVWYLFPLLFSSILDYVVGRKIAESGVEEYRRRLLIVSVVTNLGLL
jgi:alginate O-acetyltransferase complex protein AlgI